MNLSTLIVPMLAALVCSCAPSESEATIFPLSSIRSEGPLRQRLEANLQRLQQDIYQPPHVFEDLNWPGDFIGRTILGLTMDSQATGVQPELLSVLIDSLPHKLNAKGYLGPDYWPSINEQQLSGHGWLLRGLCEYYRYTGDESVLDVVRSVSRNLFVAAKGRYAEYPISPDQRSNRSGKASGTIAGQSDGWILSTDIGCVFIGMSGLIDAYEMIPEPATREVIDELVARFLEVDLQGIQAQTHATLSALRGLLKYSALTGDVSLLQEVKERWQTYVDHGMTCCYANMNWFGRPDSWTEPCAIVDSYMVALELWRASRDPSLRNLAELIEVNAIGHAQRSNGGFGCDSCPSAGNPFLTVSIPEAHWCCTMRGAEGLARMAEASWMLQGRTLIVPFYRECALCADGLEITEKCTYPESGEVSFCFGSNNRGIKALMLPDLPWAEDTRVLVNGAPVAPEKVDGMLCLRRRFAAGDTVQVSFGLSRWTDEWDGCRRCYSGPVMLGIRGESAAGHPLDEALEPVCNMMKYLGADRIQVLF